MRTPSIVLTAVLALFFTAPGCGKKSDDQARFTRLQEEHRKEIAALEARHAAQIEGYRRQLADREKELLAKSSEMAEAKRRLSERPATPAAAAPKREQKAKAAAEKAASPKEDAAETAQPEPPPMAKNLSLLEQFTIEHENEIDEGRKERYQKELGSFLAKLREQAQNEPALQRKERTLGELREKIEAETDADEREELENRMEKIENASAEDLAGVLDYYQRLDNNAELSHLMEEYNISRDELWDYGITPPPRTRWGPEIKEVAANLNAFVDDYAPLVPEDQREQYRKDFNDVVSNLSKRPTDEQVLQRKNQMLADLRARYAAADESSRDRLQWRIERLESRSLDSLRRRVQMENAREIRGIAEKYGIPRSEMYQSGVMVSRRRRRR